LGNIRNQSDNEEHGTAITICQVNYLDNRQQEHGAVKQVTRPMLAFKSFEAAQSTLLAIVMYTLKKRQMVGGE
jgi:putative transposase